MRINSLKDHQQQQQQQQRKEKRREETVLYSLKTHGEGGWAHPG